MLGRTCRYQNGRELVEFRCRSRGAHACVCHQFCTKEDEVFSQHSRPVFPLFWSINCLKWVEGCMDRQIYSRTTLRRTCKYQNSSEFVVFRRQSRGALSIITWKHSAKGSSRTRDSAWSRNFDESTFRIPRFRCYFAYIPWSSSFSKFCFIQKLTTFFRVKKPSSASSILSLIPW